MVIWLFMYNFSSIKSPFCKKKIFKLHTCISSGDIRGYNKPMLHMHLSCIVAILDFQSSQIWEEPSNDYSCTVGIQTHFYFCEKKIMFFFHLSIYDPMLKLCPVRRQSKIYVQYKSRHYAKGHYSLLFCCSRGAVMVVW